MLVVVLGGGKDDADLVGRVVSIKPGREVKAEEVSRTRGGIVPLMTSGQKTSLILRGKPPTCADGPRER